MQQSASKYISEICVGKQRRPPDVVGEEGASMLAAVKTLIQQIVIEWGC